MASAYSAYPAYSSAYFYKKIKKDLFKKVYLCFDGA